MKALSPTVSDVRVVSLPARLKMKKNTSSSFSSNWKVDPSRSVYEVLHKALQISSVGCSRFGG